MIYPKEQLSQARHLEAELIRLYGNHTLAFFGLAPENSHFFAPGEKGLVNYRLENKVAVVLGDPVCTPQAFEHVTRSFLNFCALRNWQVAFYQTHPEHLTTYRTLKLHPFKIGEEAIINPQTFTLSGSAMANVRTSCRRAEREGVTIHWFEGVPPTDVMHQLEQLSSTWLENKAGKHASERGFSMGRLDELVETAQRADMVANLSLTLDAINTPAPRIVTAVVTTSTGRACAFATFTPIYGSWTTETTATDNPSGSQGWGWTLDLMRRAPDAPPCVMELLLVRAIERFQSCKAQVVSLGLAAMADTKQEITSGQRMLTSFAADLGLFKIGEETLFKFKEKFCPSWESRYIITNTNLALPKVALAIMRIRNGSGKK